MDVDFAQWYTDVCKKAELMSYSSVKGCMIFKPAGYAIWENIKNEMDRRFKETGVENVYLPMFIPESLLEKEKDHVEGFAPEVAWVTYGGLNPLQERMCVRPTSETLFCDFYKDEIQSYRDLPKVYNQWCSVVRVNIVGAFASLWAFIFAFFPFYRIEPMEVLIQQAGKQAESYALTKNLVTYNFFGVLCLMLSIVAFGLYIWNSSQLVRAAAIIVSVADFISLMLALIVGNSEIKDIKSIITYAVQYSGSGMKTSMFVKTSVAYGFVLELIMVLIMIGSYWINEMLFRPYVLGNESEAVLNPLEGLVGTAKASYTKQMAAHMHMKNTVSSERPEQSSETSDEKI